MGGVQLFFARARQIGDGAQIDRAIGSRNAHATAGDFKIADAGFERARREFLHIDRERLRRAVHRRAAHRDRPRSAGAVAGRRIARVALQHAHLIDRNIEMLRDKLRIGGEVPLPGCLRADTDGDATIFLKPHIGRSGVPSAQASI